jgi:hypothetical protein
MNDTQKKLFYSLMISRVLGFQRQNDQPTQMDALVIPTAKFWGTTDPPVFSLAG